MEKDIYVTQSSMPDFGEYIEMIRPLWDSHWLTNMGTYHKKLENELSDYLQVKHVSLMVNGHMALELAIQSMGFPKGGEVITTPYTFISTTHAIVRNDLEPVFCDIKEDFTIDEEKIEQLITDKTVAIVPVHVYGNICNVEKIQEIADRHGLKVIYDAAHCFGETYKGKGVASFGDISVFSFHATKVFHSIEGGAVCFREDEKYKELYDLKNFGIRSEEMVVSVGANAKMNEFQAAMGLCNLKHLQEQIDKRKKVVEKYIELLSPIKEVRLNQFQDDVQYNCAYFPILLKDEKMRNDVYNELAKKRIHSRKYFYPVTADQQCFCHRYDNSSIDRARDYSKRVLVLPLYADLHEDEVTDIVRIMRKVITNEKEEGMV